MKVQQSHKLINPFGGIQFVLKQIKEHGIDTFIDAHFGSRGPLKNSTVYLMGCLLFTTAIFAAVVVLKILIH